MVQLSQSQDDEAGDGTTGNLCGHVLKFNKKTFFYFQHAFLYSSYFHFCSSCLSGVMVLCGAPPVQADLLFDKGIHAIRYLKTWENSPSNCGFFVLTIACMTCYHWFMPSGLRMVLSLAVQASINSPAWTRSSTSPRSTWRTPATLSRMPSSFLDPRSWTSVLTRLPYCCRRWWPWPTSRPRTLPLSHTCIAGGEEDL